MTWKQRYHVRSYLRSSLWIVPVAAGAAERVFRFTLPAERHAALRREHDLLDRMLEKLYVLHEDLALARIPDSQSLGGSTDATAPKWAA